MSTTVGHSGSHWGVAINSSNRMEGQGDMNSVITALAKKKKKNIMKYVWPCPKKQNFSIISFHICASVTLLTYWFCLFLISFFYLPMRGCKNCRNKSHHPLTNPRRRSGRSFKRGRRPRSNLLTEPRQPSNQRTSHLTSQSPWQLTRKPRHPWQPSHTYD